MSELERLEETISCLRDELRSMKERVIQAVSSGNYFFERPPTVLEARKWVGLTEDEAAGCWSNSAIQTWKNIEAKLKERNRSGTHEQRK